MEVELLELMLMLRLQAREKVASYLGKALEWAMVSELELALGLVWG
jgi:hypothetical protein